MGVPSKFGERENQSGTLYGVKRGRGGKTTMSLVGWSLTHSIKMGNQIRKGKKEEEKGEIWGMAANPSGKMLTLYLG